MNSRTDRTPRQRLDVDERRQVILDAATQLYRQGGYDEVTVAQVAARAQASPALVFHYFGTKAELYAAVVAAAVDTLAAAQRETNAALPQGVPVRDRVAATVHCYLDHIATHPRAWAAPLTGAQEPAQALAVREQARAGYVAALRELLGVRGWTRHEYALWGWFGFLDQACLQWVRRGCPDEERHSLTDAALGALEGALGDWAV